MKKLFTYEGNIGSYGGSDKLIELYADFSNTVAPILLHMPTGLYKYISKLGGTDHEERYIKSRYFYDSILYLRAIAVLNKDGKIAKVIVNNGYFKYPKAGPHVAQMVNEAYVRTKTDEFVIKQVTGGTTSDWISVTATMNIEGIERKRYEEYLEFERLWQLELEERLYMESWAPWAPAKEGGNST